MIRPSFNPPSRDDQRQMYDYWRQKSEWYIEEASYLIHGYDPSCMFSRDYFAELLVQHDSDIQYFDERLRITNKLLLKEVWHSLGLTLGDLCPWHKVGGWAYSSKYICSDDFYDFIVKKCQYDNNYWINHDYDERALDKAWSLEDTVKLLCGIPLLRKQNHHRDYFRTSDQERKTYDALTSAIKTKALPSIRGDDEIYLTPQIVTAWAAEEGLCTHPMLAQKVAGIKIAPLFELMRPSRALHKVIVTTYQDLCGAYLKPLENDKVWDALSLRLEEGVIVSMENKKTIYWVNTDGEHSTTSYKSFQNYMTKIRNSISGSGDK